MEKSCNFFDLPAAELSESRIYNSFKDEIPETKLIIINIIQHILSNWPDNMINVSKYAKIAPLVLDLPKNGMPYWLQKVAETKLNKKQKEISLEEFESALKYLYKSGHEINKSKVSKTLGLDKSKN